VAHPITSSRSLAAYRSSLGLLVLGACSVEPLALSTQGGLAAYASSTASAPMYKLEGWQDSDRKLLAAALDQTWGVVTSADFQNRVADVTNLHESRGGPVISGARLLELYLNDRLPVTYRSSRASGETADTGIAGDHGLTNFGIDNLARWPAGETPDELLERACMINTISHEWTHAISDARAHVRFTDGCHGSSSVPLVSYTVGSIAHCVYLEQKHVIAHDRFWPCVAYVGTATFSGLSVCEKRKWLSQI